MPLIIGNMYSRAILGISRAVSRLSEITVHGELYTFFSMVNGFDNRIENDGFVYEGRGEYVLIPYDERTDLHRHVFVRMRAGQDYTYLGRGQYETRYNDRCNKIFLSTGK